MARVECSVEETDLVNDQGRKVRGVRVSCGQCGHETESFGTTERSITRCLMLLKEECPNAAKGNFYVTE